MRFGSVCSGIEAASAAWHPLGWQAAWFSEIEPFPCSVLAHHYPSVPNHGDMTTLPERIRSGEVEAPDLFCGGTPCQAFSVAGLRQSLDDARGNLSLTFCEIANAIDDVRHFWGEPASIIFWENVPGVLSTKDNAFGCFLAELAGEDCPLQPARGRWTNAGCVYGPKRTVAWRILDAQYFGVAQRRRRVFVVASARKGFDPCAVLFESDGVRRDTPPSRDAGQSFTHDVEPSLVSSGRGVERIGETRGQDPVIGCWWDGGQLSQTLDAVLHKGQTMPEKNRFPAVLEPVPFQVTFNDANGSRPDRPNGGAYIFQTDIAGALTRADSDLKILSPVSVHGTQDPIIGENLAHALGRNSGQENAVAIPLQEVGKRTGASTTDIRAGIGIGQCGDPMYTLQADAQHGIAQSVSLRGRDGGATAELGGPVANCLRASGGGGDKSHVLAPAIGWSEELTPAINIQPTIQRGGDGGRHEGLMQPDMRVRRLTPTECERLQGFPDGYTQVPHRGKPAADGPRYKSIGNSWAVPVIRWIGQRISRRFT